MKSVVHYRAGDTAAVAHIEDRPEAPAPRAGEIRFARLLTEFGFAPVDLGALREGRLALMQLERPLSGKHFLFQG